MSILTPNRVLLLYVIISIFLLYNYGLNDSILPFFLLTVAMMGLIFYLTTTYKSTDEMFEQNGVRVLYGPGVLIIKGKQFKANQVTSVNIIRKGNIRVEASIQLEDINNPIMKVAFMRYSTAEKFMQRFSTALRKAGGSNLR